MVKTDVLQTFGKIAQFSAQTAVECRFGVEAEVLLASSASVSLTDAVAENGEVRYFGRVRFFLVYEDADKKICRSEKGVEFSAKASSEVCCPAHTARAFLELENLSVRREGSSLFLTALLGAEIELFGEKTLEYLSEGDYVLKRESFSVASAHFVKGTAETDDEFETDFLGDILLHSESVNLSTISCETGSLVLEGEVNLGILALKGSAPTSFERLVPFRIEIPCDKAQPGAKAEAHVSVQNVSIKADSDEEAGKCNLSATLTLSADGFVFEEREIELISDAFSLEREVKLSYSSLDFETSLEPVRTTERVFGKAALSSPVDFSDTFEALTLPRAEANLVSDGVETKAEGVAMATLLILGADGSRRGVELSLPFSIKAEEGGECEVSVLACGMSARQRQEGEVEAEATLKVTLIPKIKTSLSAVSAIEEGEALPVSDAAISVYVPRAGDGLWELSKSLKKPPEEVSRNNPDIEFPIKEGRRVVIYRKKTLN